MSFKMWCVWAIVLIVQNFAFTFVSRARNSGSIYRHMIASVFSNGVWFLSQIIIFSQMFAMMTGKYGLKMAVFTGVYYTVFTMAGSLAAHYFSLITEKGKGAVGANKKYAQFTKEEGDLLRTRAVFVDIGDGLGAFTPEELTKLKELAGGKIEQDTVQEIIHLSSPPLNGGCC